MVLVNVFGTKLVIKRNPWMKIDKYLAKSSHILSNVPAWTDNPALRPPGVKAINDIFEYVASHSKVAGLHPAGRVRVIGTVMEKVATFTSKGSIDSAIDAALTKHYAYVKPAMMTKADRAKRREEARARIPAYERLAATLR